MNGSKSQLPLASPVYSTLLVPKLENSLWETWNRDSCYDNNSNIISENVLSVYKYRWFQNFIQCLNLEIVIKVVSVLVHHGNIIILVQLTVLDLWRGWQDGMSHMKNHHLQTLMATYQLVFFASAVSWVPERETISMFSLHSRHIKNTTLWCMGKYSSLSLLVLAELKCMRGVHSLRTV